MHKTGNNLPPPAKVAGVIIPVIIIVAAIILNTAYRQALFLLGVNRDYIMQTNSSGLLNAVQNLFSLLASPIIVVAVLVIQLIFVKQRVRSLVYIIYLTGALYYMALLKQIFQETRPFWYNTQVQRLQWFCPSDFGNPSGHSFAIILLYEPIITDILGTGPKKVFLWIWIVIAALVMLSRMYLGSHSLDQVIFGGMLGFSCLILYKYQLQERLYEAIGNILNKKYRIFYAIINTIYFFIFLALPIVVYQINLQNRPVDQNDLINLNKACSQSFTSDNLKQASIISTALGFIAIGLLYGLLMLNNNHNQDILYLVGKWKFTSGKSIVMLILSIIVVVGIPAGILALVVPHVSSIVILNFISTAIAATWGGFALVYILSIIQNKYEWISYQPNNGSD